MFRPTALLLLIGLGFLFLNSTGCASSPADRAAKGSAASAAFDDFRGSLVETQHAVDDSLTAIDRLSASSNGANADVTFNGFLNAYFRITGKSAELSERATVMRDAGYEYFVVGSAPRLQKHAAKGADTDAQHTETRVIFERLQQRLADVRDSLASYRTDLAGVYRYLNRDLSPGQIASARDRFSTARQDAADVKSRLDTLMGDVRELGTSAGIADKK
jgi:hypothetical protein